ncbi:DUF6207 family protein [Streptomyces violaceus]
MWAQPGLAVVDVAAADELTAFASRLVDHDQAAGSDEALMLDREALAKGGARGPLQPRKLSRELDGVKGSCAAPASCPLLHWCTRCRLSPSATAGRPRV